MFENLSVWWWLPWGPEEFFFTYNVLMVFKEAVTYTSTIKIPTFSYTWSQKKVPISAGASL